MRPLLVCNVVEYRGSEVPTYGLDGMVTVEGMAEGDVLLVHNGSSGPVTVVADGTYGPFRSLTLRAQRLRSTGAEVSVWAS